MVSQSAGWESLSVAATDLVSPAPRVSVSGAEDARTEPVAAPSALRLKIWVATRMRAEAYDWLVRSASTETVADEAETSGVVTCVPHWATWTGEVLRNQTLR